MDVVQKAPEEKEESRPVTLQLLRWIRGKARDGAESKDTTESVYRCIVERSAFGKKKYDMVLKTHNGRDAELDAQQELADGLQYLYQWRMEDPKAVPSPLTVSLMELITALMTEMLSDNFDDTCSERDG